MHVAREQPLVARPVGEARQQAAQLLDERVDAARGAAALEQRLELLDHRVDLLREVGLAALLAGHAGRMAGRPPARTPRAVKDRRGACTMMSMSDKQATRPQRETGRFLRSELADDADASRSSILDIIARFKDQILEKDRIINQKTGELVAHRDYLRGIFEALADPVLVIDEDGLVEFANLAAQELLGYKPGELLGRPAATLWADPEQAARFAGDGLREALEAGALVRADLLLRTLDGRAIPVSWSSSALKSGDRVALVGVARDVRVERRLEEEKVRAVQALAASVAHEIRNPLGAIQSSVGLLRRDLPVTGEDKTLLDIVYDETHRIGRIVSQFLDFARPVRPDVERSDLGALAREVVTLLEKDERAQGKQLLVHVEAGLEPALVDPAQLKQVLWNLLKNAVDAARERVAVRLRATPAGVEVRVADDGPGMSPEVLARCFEPFRTTKAQGTGLGLAICKRIIEAHGGAIRLESAPGDGAVASFTLPSLPPLDDRARWDGLEVGPGASGLCSGAGQGEE